jgi:hypothetical protein
MAIFENDDGTHSIPTMQDMEKLLRQSSKLPTREQMERAGLAKPGASYCSEQENACEQDEGA